MLTEKINMEYLCTVIGNLSGIPIRIYFGNELRFFYSVVHLPKDPVCVDLTAILAQNEHIGYYITPMFYYYGFVRSENSTVVIGPSRQMPASEQEIRRFAFDADVPGVDTDDFVIAINEIRRMPLDSIIQILLTLNHVLNGEMLNLKDIKIVASAQEKIKWSAEQQSIHTSPDEHRQANEPFNNSFALEQTLMNIVRHGDTAALGQWIESAPAAQSGILAGEQLRQLKNTFIVTATLVCRNAIRGGMDVHDSLALSDSYIQKIELLRNMEEITNLQYSMVLDYTERVERIRRGKQPTKLAVDVTNYVLHHLSEAIKTEDIATALYLSRSRLSTKFRQETGVTLTDYILKEKAIEAKRLLRYSDKPIASISEYLGFSSQGHFTRVFKKYIGLTPNEYRERKQ